MKCPSCGVDVNVYLQEKVKRQERDKREKEFEKMYKEILRSVRRKRRVIGTICGGLIGFLWIFLPSRVFVASVLELRHFLIFIIFCSFFCALAGGFAGLVLARKPGKQEKELYKSFGL